MMNCKVICSFRDTFLYGELVPMLRLCVTVGTLQRTIAVKIG